ncbi:MAG: hypothetical protein ACI8RD_000395, partial [Bacillariaceae sp.]|jgi:hypothetical protein
VCLSVYFLLIVKFEVTEDTIARYAEPLMHMAALGFGFATAIASIVLDLFNNATIWCWIAPLPFNCTDSIDNNGISTCVRGDNSYVYRFAFFLVPLWASMFAVLGINIAIFRVVRKREANADNLHAIHHAKYGQTAASGLGAVGSEGKHYRTSVIVETVQDDTEQKRGSFLKKMSSKSFAFANSSFFNKILKYDSPEGLDDVDEKKKSTSPGPILVPLNDESVPDIIEKERHTSIRERKIDEAEETSIYPSHPLAKEEKIDSLHEEEMKETKSESLHLSSEGHLNDTKETNDSDHLHAPESDEKKQDDSEEDDNNNKSTPLRLMKIPEIIAQRFVRQHSHRQQKKQESNRDSRKSADVKFVLANIEDYPSAARQYAAAYHIGARVVKVQSIAFVVGFWMIWLLPTINRLIQHFKLENYFALIFFQALFEPLQGLFNVIIYRFSYYIRLKERYPRWTKRELLRHTYRWTFLGPPKGDPSEKFEGSRESDVDVDENMVSERKRKLCMNGDRLDSTGEINFVDYDLAAGYPSMRNNNFLSAMPEVIPDEFPTVVWNQSLSGPSDFPKIVAPIADLPIAGEELEYSSFPKAVNNNEMEVELMADNDHNSEDNNEDTQKSCYDSTPP